MTALASGLSEVGMKESTPHPVYSEHMAGWIVAAIVIGVLALFFVPLWLFERREARSERDFEADLLASHKETVAFFAREAEKERTRINELRVLSWAELRAWCERLHGHPCECSTKVAIAKRIYWHERRSETPAVQPASVSAMHQ